LLIRNGWRTINSLRISNGRTLKKLMLKTPRTQNKLMSLRLNIILDSKKEIVLLRLMAEI